MVVQKVCKVAELRLSRIAKVYNTDHNEAVSDSEYEYSGTISLQIYDQSIYNPEPEQTTSSISLQNWAIALIAYAYMYI